MLSAKDEDTIRSQYMQMAEAQAEAVISALKGLRSKLPSGMTEAQAEHAMEGVVETVLKNMTDSAKEAERRLKEEAGKFDMDKFVEAMKAGGMYGE